MQFIISLRLATRGAVAPGYPLQVRPPTNPSHFGLSTTIPGRCQHVVHQYYKEYELGILIL
ncbi:MAG: hypothetical protein ACKVOQ_10185 [Cyclobacteriaceae bacterium]